MRKLIYVLLLIIIFLSNGFAQFDYFETKNLRMVYINGLHSFLAPYTARCFENSLAFHSNLWNFKPSQKITVILHDLGDFGNAGASTIPNNRISFSIAPLNYVYETAPANERINSTMNHEMVHIVTGDQYTNSDNFFRTIFCGKVSAESSHPETIVYSYLTSPRRSAPIWYHEGIAVFMETWMAGGLGRSLGAYDEMVFRTKIYDKSQIYDPIGLDSKVTQTDFMAGVNSYLYGNRFYCYLALTYSPEKVIEWVARVNGTDKYFSSQFKETFDMTLEDAWSEWIEWEESFQMKNIDSIKTYPTTNFRNISKKALGSISRTYYDKENNKLYAGVYYPGEPAHIASIDLNTGEMEKIHKVKGAALFFVTSLAFDHNSEKLYYTTDNNAWRDIVVLDLKTKKTETLQKDTRIGDLAFNRNDESLWGVRHFNGISTLVKIIPPYDKWDQIYSWPYGKDIYDIDISPDGKKLAASMAEISGRQTLFLFDIENLEKGDSTFKTLFNFHNSIPGNFTFSDDNNYLYGSSYYSGVSNIYRYDLLIDSMEAVTNAITGFFRPIQYSNDSLIVFRYSGEGFTPVMIADTTIEDISPITYMGQEIVRKHPIVKDWMIKSPRLIELDSMIIDSGSYSGMKHLSVNSLYPIVEGYKHHTAVGFNFNISEPIGFHKATLSASVIPNDLIPNDERWHVDFNYSYIDWSFNFSYNGADFYDLFGPTKTSRKGYNTGIRYSKTLYYDPPKQVNFSASLNRYWNLVRLPDYQNVSASFDNFTSLKLSLGYHNLGASIGAVDYEYGFSWSLNSSNNYVNRHLFPQIVNNMAFGFKLPLDHTSLWFRSSTGYAEGERFEPFANFFFGGFGNNWIDYQSEKRYRRYLSFPGSDINSIAGTNFTKLAAELNLPPLRFKKFGISSFYLTWIRPALFSSAVITNFDDLSTRRKLLNVGGQLDFRMTLLSYLKMTFSIGYAVSYEKNYIKTDEFMVSLKVL